MHLKKIIIFTRYHARTNTGKNIKKMRTIIKIKGISEKIFKKFERKYSTSIAAASKQFKRIECHMNKKGIIYKNPCCTCNFCYISETGSSLATRSEEHEHAIKSGNINNVRAKPYWKKVEITGPQKVYST